MRERERKKFPISVIVFIILLGAIGLFVWRYTAVRDVEFRAGATTFQIKQNGEWQDFLIKGVNLGLGKPFHFPGEVQITKDEYMRWFEQIADMNANSIRVYTIQSPEFYEALFRFNFYAKNPLYLFHGAWIDEVMVEEHLDAYAPDLLGDYENEMRKMVDVVHGNTTIEERRGHASGKYMWDVSPYLAGYILGIELDAAFVVNTNEQNAHITEFDGRYLYTENASPHEAWLAHCGDFVISYEQDNYNTQRPISWVNWLTTDPMWHSNEPDKEKEDIVSVDTEHVLAKDNFNSGLFASYHVYPYYPEFMIYQPEYATYIDDKGNLNPYKAYLLDLEEHHTVPLLVAEFGIPSSRGGTHNNHLTGYNQGNVSETQQGEYVADMFDSIVSSGCAGGMVFTWQDEWFKRSWNTMDYDIPERRAFWANYQVSEQNYGVMAFEPGNGKEICRVDGDAAEWKKIKPMLDADGAQVSIISDERFVYFMIRDIENNAHDSRYVIGVDSLPEQGNTRYDELGISFDRAVESAIIIDGTDGSSIKVDSYYDVFYRLYATKDVIEDNPVFEQKNSGLFNPIYLMLVNKLLLPLTGEVIPPLYYDTGKLVHGNANPTSSDFNSLADFCISDDGSVVEIRIPWQLLGAADPSQRMMIGDLYAAEEFSINPTEVDGMYIELHASGDDSAATPSGSAFYTWDKWDAAPFHERLKQSYYILKDKFGEY